MPDILIGFRQERNRRIMGILIRQGRLLDAATGMDRLGDLYLDDGVIVEIGENIATKEKNDQVIDADGCFVMPGIVDMHVHLRDPGQTEKEDIESGTRAAAHGGVTTLAAMPNTFPVIDRPDRLSYVIHKAYEVSPVHVLQVGAITLDQKGKELSDIEGMVRLGCRAVSEDGKSVLNSQLMREAMQIAARLDIPVLDHCEDLDLRGDGCMNEDENARRLKLPGIPNLCEDVIAARDILIARETGARLHLCHCSTEETARMLQAAKREGCTNISGEVCPHHLLLTSDDIKRDDPNFKMNPPLRTRKDVDALLEALSDGSIGVISTDHAPHTAKDKSGSMKTAAFGIVGIETSLALIYTGLVEKGILTPLQMVEKMCYNPAKILGLDCGTLKTGHPADVIVADFRNEYTIETDNLMSRGKNTPFIGTRVRGSVLYTICGGKIVWERSHGKIQQRRI